MGEVRDISKKISVLFLIIILTLFGFLTYVQQASGGGTVTVLGASARIDNYKPNTKITVSQGESFTLEVWFTNTGGSGAYFYAGATIWDSSGNQIQNLWSGKIYVDAGKQGHVSWTTSINTVGEYWLQFGIWNEAKTTLLAKAPSPSQNLIKVTAIDNPPRVEAFDVSPRSTTLGNPFTISYTVSDDKGLTRVELWRAEDSGGSPVNWQKIKEVSVSGTRYSGSFSDAPTSVGSYWYGIHVVDTAGQWVTEPSPIRVTVSQITSPTISKTFSVTISPGGSAEDTIVIYNPNNVKITVKSFTITDYGGFKGSVTVLTSLPFDISAYSSGEIRVRITANSDCPAGTFTIKYKIIGDPNNWEVLGD